MSAVERAELARLIERSWAISPAVTTPPTRECWTSSRRCAGQLRVDGFLHRTIRLIRVDTAGMDRVWKDSAYWFQRLCATRTLALDQ